MSTKVKTGKVRLSYVNLLTPFAFEDQEPKYSCTLMIPKSDKETLRTIRGAIKEAIDTKGLAVFGGKIPAKVKDNLLDADVDTRKDGDTYADANPEYKGHYIITVSNKSKPQVVDRTLSPLTSPEDVYSGMYARVTLTAFCYNHPLGGKGVSCSLGNVQKLGDGERFDNRSSAEDDFDEWEDDEDGIL
jgi:hypothetical protein